MALLQSLEIGRMGLVNNQLRMDTIGNNLANVNTVSYKKESHQFEELFARNLTGGTASGGGYGGTNPISYGLGTTTSSIIPVFSQGQMEETGKQTDLAVEGSGFFVVRANSEADTAQYAYTRDGSFFLGQPSDNATANWLLSADGWPVQGYAAVDEQIPTDAALSHLTIPLNQERAGVETTTAQLRGNLDSGAVGADLQGRVTDQVLLAGNLTGNTSLPLTVYVNREVADAEGGLHEEIVGQPLTLNFTQTTADANGSSWTWQAGDAAGSLSFAANGQLSSWIQTDQGADKIAFDLSRLTQTEVGGGVEVWQQNGNPDGTLLQAVTVYDAYTEIADKTSDGIDNPTAVSVVHPRQVDLIFTPGTPGTGYTDWTWNCNETGGAGTLRFNASGQTVAANTAQTTAGSVAFDLASLTQVATDTKVELDSNSQDGYPPSEMEDFTIDTNGRIWGVYGAGRNELLGQIALAKIPNPEGLNQIGGNLYRESSASGEPLVGLPNTGARGIIKAGYLELSNVDMGQETTNLILTQRGYQLTSRIVSTSNELLVELLNLKR